VRQEGINSPNASLQDRRRHLAAPARKRVHGQPDRGGRRAVVAGDGRPRPATTAGLTTASVEMKWVNGWSAAATFEGGSPM
jgi:hypothetical protein